MKNCQKKNESALFTFAKVFLDQCRVIEIRSWDSTQAIKMYNSLNSKGKPISDADIISAKLYSNSPIDLQNIFKNEWEYIIKQTEQLDARKIVDINSVLQQFMYINRAIEREYINNNSVNVTTPGLRRYYTELEPGKLLLKEPKELCENLIKIIDFWDKIKDFPSVKLLLKFNENVKLYLASYLYRFDLIDITTGNLIEICDCLMRLFTILELVEAGYSSSKFKTFLFRINILLVDPTVSISEIKSKLNEHIILNWKEEDLFEDLLEYEKNMLVFLNEYLYSKSKNLDFDFKPTVNIEHIMPSSGRDKETIKRNAGFKVDDDEKFEFTVNKLGNKILLEDNINKSLGIAWFETKKTTTIRSKSGYVDSNYHIAKALTNFPRNVWTKEDIDVTTAKVAKRIINFIFDK